MRASTRQATELKKVSASSGCWWFTNSAMYACLMPGQTASLIDSGWRSTSTLTASRTRSSYMSMRSMRACCTAGQSPRSKRPFASALMARKRPVVPVEAVENRARDDVEVDARLTGRCHAANIDGAPTTGAEHPPHIAYDGAVRAEWSPLLLATALAACHRPAPPPPPPAPWPVFPRTPAERARLIAQETKRPVGDAGVPLTPEQIVDAAARAGWTTLPSGETRVRDFVAQRLSGAQRAWLLFGTFHDSADQVEAFTRLVEPGGPAPFDALVLEQLRADGRWQNDDGGQAGETRALERYLATGAGDDFEALARAHDAHDYTAWKYGYEHAVLRLVTLARGMGISARACDLPAPLMEQLGDDDQTTRLRELHCRLAFDDGGPAPRRIAMLWGQAHTWPDGFRRFLPPEDAVLALEAVGGRHSADAPDSLLRARLVLNDEVVVPLGPHDAALLLPGRFLGGDVERAREPLPESTAAPSTVTVSADEPGELRVGPVALDARESEQTAELAPGAYTYCFTTRSGLTVVGAVELPPGGSAVLRFEPRTRLTRVWVGPAT